MQLRLLHVDGGASANDFLMQFQADILDTPIIRPASTEATALGAAFLAGLYTGFWPCLDALSELPTATTTFEPDMDALLRTQLLAGWADAVGRTRTH
jgi:glycerol kinase